MYLIYRIRNDLFVFVARKMMTVYVGILAIGYSLEFSSRSVDLWRLARRYGRWRLSLGTTHCTMCVSLSVCCVGCATINKQL